jgi:PAS domain S-box-containing protein
MNAIPLHLYELGANISLLIALTFLYGFAKLPLRNIIKLKDNLILGSFFGIFAVVTMLMPIELANGVILDGRGLMLAIAGLVGGWRSGYIAAALVIFYRVIIGGPGVAPSAAAALTSASLGVLLHARYMAHPKGSSRLLLLLGFAVAAQVLLWTWLFLVPQVISYSVFASMLVPVLLIFPIGTWTLGTLIGHERRRLEAEQAVLRNRAYYRTLTTNIPNVAAFLFDHNLKLILADGSTFRKQGFTPEIMEGKRLPEVMPPERAEKVLPYLQSALDGVESTFDWKYGDQIFMLHTVPIRHGSDNISECMLVSHEITEIKQIEEQLRQSETRFRGIFEAAPTGIAIGDQQGTITEANPAFTEMLGYKPEEIRGMNFAQFTHADDLSRERELIQEIVERKRSFYQMEKRYVRKNGEVFWVLLTGSMIQDNQGEYAISLGIVEDISERKKAEEQAFELALEREQVGILRRFISDASHDLRTPITILNTSLYLQNKFADRVISQVMDLTTQLSSPETKPEALSASIQEIQQLITKFHDRTHIFEDNVLRLRKIVENMLDLSRLDSQNNLEVKSVDLYHITRMLVETFLPTIAEKHLTLHFHVPAGVLMAPIDEVLYTRMIQNLLDNAMQYTSSGGKIYVEVFQQSKQAIIQICDTGIGISMEDLPYIFDRFYRADKARTANTGGSGLGLAIVKKIAELHHGRVEVESEVNVGTTFKVILPL